MRWAFFCAFGLFATLLAADAAQRVPNEATGSIAAVDVTKSELTVTTQHGQRTTFKVSRVARIFINNRAARLAELSAGDSVRVVFEAAGKDLLATEIRATQM
ncbi:MAG: hypothetical protein FJ271_20570 [Planctomycetes bacterium]|nr:hypothetical protein [Planctomycetota bacterium]